GVRTRSPAARRSRRRNGVPAAPSHAGSGRLGCPGRRLERDGGPHYRLPGPLRSALRRLMTIRNKTAIVGIGQTEFSKDSGRSTLHMALEAILEAPEDAGLKPADIDGVVKMAANDDGVEIALLRSLGRRSLRFFAEI